MSRRKPSLWPDYCSRDTLAARLDVAPDYIDQLVKRGVLPPATVTLGEAKRWRWSSVESLLSRIDAEGYPSTDQEDPYLAGIERGATKEANH